LPLVGHCAVGHNILDKFDKDEAVNVSSQVQILTGSVLAPCCNEATQSSLQHFLHVPGTESSVLSRLPSPAYIRVIARLHLFH
jgi:hypothetical protein